MAESRISRTAYRCGFVVLVLSAALWLATTICFVGVWDSVAAITTFPQWLWASIGMLSGALAWRLLRGHSRLPLVLIGLWLLTTLYFADNSLPIIRGLIHRRTPAQHAPTGTVRVVTLNCASSAAAAQEVMKFRPDIVLLQESPTSNKVAQLARDWFGDAASFVVGMDCAIVSHYPLKAVRRTSFGALYADDCCAAAEARSARHEPPFNTANRCD
jgi:hypothetical protein